MHIESNSNSIVMVSLPGEPHHVLCGVLSTQTDYAFKLYHVHSIAITGRGTDDCYMLVHERVARSMTFNRRHVSRHWAPTEYPWRAVIDLFWDESRENILDDW